MEPTPLIKAQQDHIQIKNVNFSQKFFFSFNPHQEDGCLAGMQGCQIAYIQTKNTNLVIFWRALEWKRLICLMANWNFL
jgi:hypothetical protein